MASSRFLSRFLSTSLIVGAPTMVSAGTLQLSAGGTYDISSIPVTTVGDLSVSSGRIWIADGATGGQIYAINVLGTLVNTVSPALVPGLTNGPDALCIIGASDLILFSSFGESVAGRIKWTDNTLDAAYPS